MKKKFQIGRFVICVSIALLTILGAWMLSSRSTQVDYRLMLCGNGVKYWSFKETLDEKGCKVYFFNENGRYDILEYNQEGTLVSYRSGCSRWEGRWSINNDTILVMDDTRFLLQQIDDSTLLITSESERKVLHQKEASISPTAVLRDTARGCPRGQ